jgi:hypothetical protein
MSELIHNKFVCKFYLPNSRPYEQIMEFDNLEELLFHIAFIMTTKTFDRMEIVKQEVSRERA